MLASSVLAESSLSESPRVQKQRERGLDYEYDFIDDSRPLLFLNSGSAPRPTLAACTGAGRRAAVGRARRSSLPGPARVGGTLLSLAPLSDSGRSRGGCGGSRGRCARMWIETALLYAWIRVCLRGAGSPPCLCLEQRNCAGHAASPQPLWTVPPRTASPAVVF